MAEKKVKVTFDYDENTDVMTISFGTGEPSFSEELNDHILADFGIYTGAPTGLQILHVKDAGINPVNVFKKSIPIIEARFQEMQKAVSAQRKQMLKNTVDSLPSRLKELVPA